MSELESNIETLKKNIKEYPDFPTKGVLFRDIFSVFQDPTLLNLLNEVALLKTRALKGPVQCIVALDARGFLFGPFLASQLKVPFVPVRKKGKLPGLVETVTYQKEYGEDVLEIQMGVINKGQNVLIVDDLLATGGSMGAACKLVEKLGAKVISCLVVMELAELQGRKKVPAEVNSIITY